MKKVISIFLSFIILVSSMGITFSTHFCMGRAMESALMIGEHDLSCGMLGMDEGCETDVDDLRLMAPGCCDNEFLTIKIQDEYQKVSEVISLHNHFLFAVSYAFLIDNLQESEQVFAQSEIYPPPLEQDYQSLYQSFLL